MFGVAPTPNDLADLLTYTYDELGRLEYATAGVDTNGDGVLDANDTIITENLYTYDARGNLLREYQSYGELVDINATPYVEYGRAYSAYPAYASSGYGNHDRLASMTYPAREQTGLSRVVSMTYGSADIDDALSRVTRIADTTGASAERAIDFEHAGSSRRVGRTWLDDVGGTLTPFLEQVFEGGAGYSALDRRGRTLDLAFQIAGATPTIVHRYEYGYDSVGNRLFERVEQAGESNTRSWLYGYDSLGRLRSAERGELNSTNDAINLSLAIQSTRVDWGLDRLGNWTELADGTHEGRVETQDLDGLPGYEDLVLAQDHSTDLRNELTNVNEDDGTTQTDVTYVHDAAGNLVSDGTYFYQYDAFNRLAAVHELGTLGFDADGTPDSGTQGDWRAGMSYDALGRRVAKESPWSTSQTEHRTAWYHYDGVRRILEVHKDPVMGSIGGIGGAPPAGGGGGSHVIYTDREYVWGPDYVDECLWQIDRPGNELFVLSLYQYLGSRPLAEDDALGLFFGLGDIGVANDLLLNLSLDNFDLNMNALASVTDSLSVEGGGFIRAGAFFFGLSRGKTAGAKATPLSLKQKKKLRSQAGRMFTKAHGKRASEMSPQMAVHHVIGLNGHT